jgi:tetratricopeptide (TPR) repeat protein
MVDGERALEKTSHLPKSLWRPTMPGTENQPGTHHASRTTHHAPRSRHPRRTALFAAAVAVAASAVAYLAYGQYRLSRRAATVRSLFAAHRYDEVGEPLRRWIRERPDSAEAQYYRAWLALVANQPGEAQEAIDRATKLGFDRTLLDPLTGIYQARAGRIGPAESLLREAFDRGQEPRAAVAQELARIYLSTYRLLPAAVAIERWRNLAPEDPRPYLWSNEIASRTDAEPSILIRNYRAALDRDPDLDKARLGLAEQLSKARRFDEAESEYRAYLQRQPRDASALVGLGRDALQRGDLDGAGKSFEAALALDPRQPGALKELAQIDLRLDRYEPACRRLEALIPLEPYDPRIRSSYARALEQLGDRPRARSQAELAARLQRDLDRYLQLQYNLLKNPTDLETRSEIARWLLEHGQAEDGLRWTEEILRMNPRHPPTHRALADYYQKRGDAGRANYHRLMAPSGPDGGPAGPTSPAGP